jgi:hypothetical protein
MPNHHFSAYHNSFATLAFLSTARRLIWVLEHTIDGVVLFFPGTFVSFLFLIATSSLSRQEASYSTWLLCWGYFFFLLHELAKSRRWHARPCSSPFQPFVVPGIRRVYLGPRVDSKWEWAFLGPSLWAFSFFFLLKLLHSWVCVCVCVCVVSCLLLEIASLWGSL